MIYVGIDVAKDKHDCFIINSEGEVLYDVFTIQNNIDGFNDLLFKIKTAEPNPGKVKAGLEATGHYSCNILGFLKNAGLNTVVINPLYTSLSRKSISLRKTKTDKVDARTIASMIMSDVSLKPFSDALYHNEDLKSLTRYRFDKISQRAKLKQSISRLVNILFPELEKLVSTLHSKQSRRAAIEAFLATLAEAKLVDKFDTALWCGLVDFVTVHGKDDVRFTFKNGQEIKA